MGTDAARPRSTSLSLNSMPVDCTNSIFSFLLVEEVMAMQPCSRGVLDATKHAFSVPRDHIVKDAHDAVEHQRQCKLLEHIHSRGIRVRSVTLDVLHHWWFFATLFENEKYDVVRLLLDRTEHLPTVAKQCVLYYAAYYNLPEFANAVLSDTRVDVNFSDKAEPALLQAAMMGSTEVVACLMQAPAIRVNQTSIHVENMTPLYVAIQGGHTAIVEMLLGDETLDASALYGGETYLHHAVRAGNTEIFKLLVEDGRFDLSTRSECGETVLCLATQQCKRLEILELILQSKSDLNGSTGVTHAHSVVGGSQEVPRTQVAVL